MPSIDRPAPRGLRDDPETYIPGDRRRALAAGESLPDRVNGAALFADISGFTPLTEALAAELGPQRGAEELTAVLETVFAEVLGELHRYDGHAIYFSGDAVTCWIDRDDGRLATRCALGMQEAIDRVGTVRTPGGREVRLAMKVAVAVGSARRFVVGDPSIQLIDVLAGALMDDLAAAEHAAAKGEVVVDESVIRSLGSLLECSEQRVSQDSGSLVGVVRRLTVDVPPVPPQGQQGRLSEDVVRQWLLPPVYERMRSGRGEFLAELRPAIPLFLRFGGLDFDADASSVDQLHDFIVRAQRIIDEYGGSTLQLTVGDKGAYLYAVFGSPMAHEDDAARVCGAALDLIALEPVSAVTGLRIGVTQGRLRSGTYGHQQRRTFCCLGDAVNLAARLMSAAPAGEIYVSDRVAADAGDGYVFAPLPELHVKGKARPVTAFHLTGRRPAAEQVRTGERQRLVGRDEELQRLNALAELALAGNGQIVGISAEAGIGKSRLIAELAAGVATQGIRTAQGTAQSYGLGGSYSAWRDVWRTLLEVTGAPSPDELLRHLAGVLPAALAPRLPLLGTLLGIPLPDNDLTAPFDAKLRKTSLESLTVQLLAELAGQEPLLLILEDCHRLDPLSQDLLTAVARAGPSLPILLALGYRSAESPFAALGLGRLAHATEIVLQPLTPAATAQVVTDRLALLFGPTQPLSSTLIDLLAERSEGNPLYVRELCSYLFTQGVDPQDAAAVTELDLPESLHSLVLSRIDTLSESPRRTAKVASVVGRAFRGPLLPGVYPELGDDDDVRGHLHDLAGHDVVALDELESQSYRFTHAITCDVAYQSMPFAMRAKLHEGVADCLERGEDGDPERQLDRLAHHYWRSTNEDQKRRYLLRAGIAAQADYANAAALKYFRRIAPLLPPDERAPVLIRTGKVLEIGGDWSQAQDAYTEALEVAVADGDPGGAAWARTWLAEVARKRGRYDEAAEGLSAAAEEFQRLGDDAGAGQVLHFSGTLAAQRGDYDGATQAYDHSYQIRERLGDIPSMAALLSNLAIVAEYRGDYEEAQDLNERALALRERDGNKWAIGVSQNNLGMIAVLRGDYAGAKDRFSESMRLHQLVGDTWMVGLGHNNLGNAHRGLGEYDQAGGEYAAALGTYRAYDDDWALAILYEDVALLAAATGPVESCLRLIGAADAMRVRIGSPRAPDVQAQIDRALAALGPGLGTVADGFIDAGRHLTGSQADSEVLLVCGPVAADAAVSTQLNRAQVGPGGGPR
ncbi:MAG: tetratricopeptide repeat protein [Geodermatophilaceae bacterium]|nr:tetratricopeptide repeat protein [Geodermatophilaceae bacterium]